MALVTIISIMSGNNHNVTLSNNCDLQTNQTEVMLQIMSMTSSNHAHKRERV